MKEYNESKDKTPTNERCRHFISCLYSKNRWLRINRDGTKIDPGQQAEQPQPTDEPQTDDSKAKDVADGEGGGNEGEDEEEVANQESILPNFFLCKTKIFSVFCC